MTFTFSPRTVAASIAGLTISGLTLYDLGAIPQDPGLRETPMMLPAPNFVTEFDIVRDSYGAAGAGQFSVTYVLNWRVLFEEVGAERGLADIFPALLDMWALIVKTVMENDSTSTAEDLAPRLPVGWGIVAGPNDKQFFGFDFGIQVTELVN